MTPESVIRKPIFLTEKSNTLRAKNQVVFEVLRTANKVQIKEAVQKLFTVKVMGVNTARVHGKFRRHGKSITQRPDWKKAFVTLKEGDAIELF